jgi:hypothetical protein
MRIAVEQIEGLRYKLRMMGVPIEGPANVFCDNQSVFKNCSYPESTLKKKHNAIAYHRVREAQASRTIRVAWESWITNLSDILTKLLPGPRLRELSRQLLHWRPKMNFGFIFFLREVFLVFYVSIFLLHSLVRFLHLLPICVSYRSTSRGLNHS